MKYLSIVVAALLLCGANVTPAAFAADKPKNKDSIGFDLIGCFGGTGGAECTEFVAGPVVWLTSPPPILPERSGINSAADVAYAIVDVNGTNYFLPFDADGVLGVRSTFYSEPDCLGDRFANEGGFLFGGGGQQTPPLVLYEPGLFDIVDAVVPLVVDDLDSSISIATRNGESSLIPLRSRFNVEFGCLNIGFFDAVAVPYVIDVPDVESVLPGPFRVRPR